MWFYRKARQTPLWFSHDWILSVNIRVWVNPLLYLFGTRFRKSCRCVFILFRAFSPVSRRIFLRGTRNQLTLFLPKPFSTNQSRWFSPASVPQTHLLLQVSTQASFMCWSNTPAPDNSLPEARRCVMNYVQHLSSYFHNGQIFVYCLFSSVYLLVYL